MVHRSETTTHRTDCTLPSQRSLKKIGVGGRENHKQALDPKWSFNHSCLLHLPPPPQTQQNSTAMLLLAVPALHNIACCIPTAQPSLPPSTRQIKKGENKTCNYCWVCFSSHEHIPTSGAQLCSEGVCWWPACISRSCDLAALPCCAWTPDAVKWFTGVKPQPTGPTVHSLPALSRSSTFAQCLHQLPIASWAAGRYMSGAEDQFQPQCVDTWSLTTCRRPLA